MDGWISWGLWRNHYPFVGFLSSTTWIGFFWGALGEVPWSILGEWEWRSAPKFPTDGKSMTHKMIHDVALQSYSKWSGISILATVIRIRTL